MVQYGNTAIWYDPPPLLGQAPGSGPFKRLMHQLPEEDAEDEELLARLAMLADNLPAFIKYKRDHGC